MDAPHQWQAGANPLAPIWPLVPPLKPDEVISSWLARCALAMGCDPLTLTNSLWPGTRFWCKDPDRPLGLARTKELSVLAGIPAYILAASTLSRIQSVLAGPQGGSTHATQWVLCLGIRNRRRAGGLQYCPACFAEEGAYYKVQSRLAWHSSCPKHRLTLLSSCQSCNAPLCPHLLMPPDLDLGCCHRCHYELASASAQPALMPALDFQETADGLFSGRQAVYGSHLLELEEWFYVCRWLLGILRWAARFHSACTRPFFTSFDVDYMGLTVPALGLPFQYLPPGDRARLLRDTWAMLQAGPEKLSAAAQRLPVPLSMMRLPAGDPPACVQSIFAVLHGRHNTEAVHHRAHADHTTSNVLMQWQRLLRKLQR